MVNIIEGKNKLDVQLERLPPDIQFTHSYWDETPPFQAPSQHKFSAPYQNLSPFGFWFDVESYVNGELYKTSRFRAPGGESGYVIEWFTFNTAGTYTITVKALYDGQLLDQISSTVTVKPPAPTEVIDGRLRLVYVRWEDEMSWRGLRDTNNWPADKQMIIKVSVLNTGNVRATFRIAGMPDSISLVPGEDGIIDVPPFYAVDGTYTWKLYADGKKVDEVTFSVTTY